MKIAHLADIHIQDSRRLEYSRVFSDLYASLRITSPDIIAVCGDLVENKESISVENIHDLLNFIKSLAAISTVVVIPGNHDMKYDSENGFLDIIGPIISSHCVYSNAISQFVIKGLNLVLIPSLINSVEDLPIPNKDAVVLFHTNIQKNTSFEEETYMPHLHIDYLKSYSLALGGHVHETIILDNTIAYPGTLIQQSISEPHSKHGYLLWEKSDTWSHTFVEIENKKGGFIRVELDDSGTIITDIPQSCMPIYWDVKIYAEATNEAIEKTIQSLRSKFNCTERLVNMTIPSTHTSESTYLSIQDAIQDIGLDFYKDIPINSMIELVDFKFSNYACYGPDNYVSFDDLSNKLSYISAPNTYGKTTIIEAILFALYDDKSRSKLKFNSDVELRFKINGTLGKISKIRSLKTKKYELVFGESHINKGVNDTKKMISKLIGDGLSYTYSSRGFEKSTPAERKQIVLSYLFGLPNKKPSDLYDRILRKSKLIIEKSINDILSLLSVVQIRLTDSYDLITSPPIISGYQSLVLDIAFRIAFNKLSIYPQVDALIIDEGFESCDPSNLKKLQDFLINYSKTASLTLIISHIEKWQYDYVIYIQKQNDVSILSPPVSNTQFYCFTCRQSISIRSKHSHLQSVKHRKLLSS